MPLRLFAALLLAGLTAPASAHKSSDSYLSLRAAGQQVEGRWDIALRDLDFAIGIDGNGDGALTWDEVRERHAAIAAYAQEHLALQGRAGQCQLTVGEQMVARHSDGAYTVLPLRARCAAPLRLTYTLLAGLDAQHRGLLNFTQDGATSSAVLGGEQAQFEAQAPPRWRQFADYLRHGAWHIWIGYDHILFLLSLLLPAVLAASLRPALGQVLKVVTAFTLAHSVTLTLAALQVANLPSRLVEATIAASVVAAALNNLFPLVRRRLWLAAFAFGLVHGFGFAGVLAGLGLPQGAAALALAGFNIGVEAGQLAIVAAFLPLAWLMRTSWLYRRVLLQGGSAAIALVGVGWLGERALGA
ncbi:MAG: hypothetical protein K0R43_2907 [Pseudoduganella sp.]|nr:hypothetical protein [Pseudoduganella sp.]